MLVACDIGDKRYSNVVFGSVWAKASDNTLNSFNSDVMNLRLARSCWGSFQWKSTKNEKVLETYKQFINLFFSHNLCFSALVVNKATFREFGSHMGTNFSEAIPKFSQMHLSRRVKHFCDKNDEITVLLDRGEHNKRTLDVRDYLKQYITSRLPYTDNTVKHVQEISSEKLDIIQVCDLFTGAITNEMNGLATNDKNSELIRHIKAVSGRNLVTPTPSSEDKFNIWHWSPGKPRF